MSGIAQEQAEALAEQLPTLDPAWEFTPEFIKAINGWVVQCRDRAFSGRGMPVISLKEFEQHHVHKLIVPYLNADNPSLPTFTAEDVKAYVLAHPTHAFVNTSTATADDITVVFMTSAEGGKLLNNISIGPDPEAPVFVVQIRSKWREDAPILNPRRPITPGGPAFAYRAYNARTSDGLVLCWNTEQYLEETDNTDRNTTPT